MCIFFCFFFFKQKTAYEMRISDWSSDVCSSDLFSNSALYTVLGSGDDLVFEPERASGFEGGLKSTLFDRQLRANIALYSYKYKNFQIDFQNSQTFAFITTNAGSVREIGRASCRERVCQYV